MKLSEPSLAVDGTYLTERVPLAVDGAVHVITALVLSEPSVCVMPSSAFKCNKENNTV